MDKSDLFDAFLKVAKVATPMIVTERVYNGMFNHHINSYKPLSFSLDDFPRLEREKYTFKSGKNTLVGYVYNDKNLNPDKIIVFSHGYGGGGHHTYLDLINAFCKRGFYVFGYDATANDESEGEKLRGFTQGYLDADKAISFIESNKKYNKLPLYLVGHSWGAYSSSTALKNHKNVKGVLEMSGFNKATEIFKCNGEKYAGEEADKFMIYVDTYEKMLFGNDSNNEALDAFKNSNAKIAIVHSKDDNTVPIEAGYNKYYEAFKNDPRFLFIKYQNKGHGTVYYSTEGKEYYDSFNAYLKSIVKQEKMTDEEKENYIKTHLNRSIWNNMVNEELIDKVITFWLS